ncbi:MAG: tyrosine-type recombinase/integrase [Bacteroidetes bacterium]|nr:tyrosine-type recombinase/integrase [Bacteroidota bacterium]MCL5739235.1 tyrosine-type recombinase/integrase [Bacteroidota bacterium]
MFLFKRRGYYQLEYFDEAENRSRRISTGTKHKPEALRFLANLREELAHKPKIEAVTLSGFTVEYISFLRAGRSPNYVTSADFALNRLLQFTGDLPLSRLHVRNLEQFFTESFQRTKQGTAHYYRTIKAAFSKAVEWNYLSENPLKRIKLPKIPKSLPLFISEIELASILESLQGDGRTKQDMRDLFTLAFYTGLRLSELLNLEWNDVSMAERIIKVANTETFTTKSKRERIIPLNQTALEMLKKRQPKVFSLDEKNYVFQKHPGLRYERDFVSKQFKKAVRATELNGNLHFHSLRHSFASNLVQRGVPIVAVKELLGHSSIATTMIYSHVRREDLANAVKMLDGH